MSDTPRTDSRLTAILDSDGFVHNGNCPQRWVNHARELERELNAANDRIKRLHDGVLQQNQNIEQTCGKVLGYSWFKDDQKNFPGATEKDGVCVGEHVAETIVSELAKRHTEVLARIKRLEEAGDAMMSEPCEYTFEQWIKAKEAKP